MKKILLLLLLISTHIFSWAQTKQSDIFLMPALQTTDEAIAKYGKQQLLSKLSSEISSIGYRGVDVARFIVLMKIEPIEKQNSGQLLLVKYNVELSVEDLLMHNAYSHFIIELSGVGNSEGQAIMDAAKKMNLKKNNFADELKKAVADIVAYYSTNCSSILQTAQAHANAGNYEEAFANFYQLPSSTKTSCKAEYEAVQRTLIQDYATHKCNTALQNASTQWAVNPNEEGAKEVATILSGLEITKECKPTYDGLMKEIKVKRFIDVIDERKLKIKMYNDDVNLEKDRIEANKQTAIAFYKSTIPNVYLKM